MVVLLAAVAVAAVEEAGNMEQEWYWTIWLVFATILPTALIILLIVRLRSMKRYVLFCLVDGTTGKPVAGARVSGIKVSHTYVPSYATSVGGQAVYAVDRQFTEKLKPLGYTDEEGIFQTVIGYTSYSSLWIEHIDPQCKGMVAVNHVSRQGCFPDKPYKCRVAFGMIQPPAHIL